MAEVNATDDPTDDVPSGEQTARDIATRDNTPVSEATTDDPTGGTHEQVAAKQAANAMGDQDAVNQGYNPPPGSEIPTAENVRRYPELFNQSVIDSFNVPEKNDDGSYNESDVIASNPPTGEEVAIDPTTVHSEGI